MQPLLNEVVSLVTSSLVLFSSIGIFVLTLNARYTHTLGRVREIFEELKISHDPNTLNKELDAMVYRCHLLKWSFALLLCSALSSGIFLLSAILSRFWGITMDEVLLVAVVASVFFIFSSMVFLFADVLASLKSTLIHIGRHRP